MFVNPPELEECRSYSEFKGRVKAWKGLTHVKEEQQGAVIAYNITNDSKFGPDLQEHIYDELDQEKLNDMKDGVQKVLSVLDKYLMNTGMGLAAERFDAFLNVSRKPSQTIKQYMGVFEKVCKNYNESIGQLSQLAKALMLLRTAKVSDTQYEMIMAMSEGNQNTDTIYDKIKSAVTTQLTDKVNDIKGAVKETIAEAAFTVQSDDEEDVIQAKEVLAASFYKKQAWQRKKFQQHNNKQSYQQQPHQQQQYRSKPNYQQSHNQQHKQQYQQSNKNKSYSKPAQKQADEDEERCFFCRSKTHTLKDCFAAKKMRAQYQNRKRNNGQYYANMAEGEQEEQHDQERDQESYNPDQESDNEGGYPIGSICLSDTFLSETRISRFTEEAIECAAIDTCCSQTVCGKQWFNDYYKKIPLDIQHLVKGPMNTEQNFRFGDNKVLKADEKWVIPAYLGEKLVLLEVYIIPSDIPMLLSKSDLQASDAILYMGKDMARLNGTMVHLQTTTAGHYIVPLLKNDPNIIMICDVFAIDLINAPPDEQIKHLNKLHKQFGHRPKEAFIDVLKHANSWTSKFNGMLDNIIDACEGCIIRKRNPDRPAVAMLMAKDVNDTVAMDLKKLKNGKHIIYIIDVFSRFVTAKIISRKKPEEVIDAVMEKWVSTFGTPTRFLTDNGGEFCNSELQLANDKLNIIHKTTGAESPWQNGLCERNHATVDNILEALEQDYPKIPLETLLLWACVAKNSMLMHQGFSPYQIMFGKNPKLPNIITDPLPAWENEGVSTTLVKHLEAMKATRKAFIEAEDSKKLKLALEKKVRTNNTVYKNGDSIYFKRLGVEGWTHGKVVFQDGKVIFVRNGAYLYRCSANRIIKAGQELSAAKAQEEGFETADEGEDNEQTPVQEPGSIQPDQSTPVQEQDSIQPDQNEIPQDHQHTNLESNISGSDTDEHQVKNTAKPSKGRKKKKGKKANNTKQYLKLAKEDLVECKVEGVWITGKVLRKAGKSTGKYAHAYYILLKDKEEWIDTTVIETRKTTEGSILAMWVHHEIMATMVTGEKKNSPESLQAKEDELKKLSDFDTYEEIPDNGQETLSTTWVLTEKEGKIRARLTARGFEEQSNVRSDSPTVESSSMRFLLTAATTKQWPVSTIDIKSAFLQGQELKRDVYIKPPKESNAKGCIWKLRKCLYGLNDASKQWYNEMESRFDKLKFQKSCQDPAFYFYKVKGEIKGMVALHVDDFLYAGDRHFIEKVIPELLKGLIIGKTEVGEFTYTGLHVKQDSHGITLDQNQYLSLIEIPQLDAQRLKELESNLTPDEVTHLRQIMGKVNWVIRITRPDLSYDMVYLSTRFHRGTISDIKDATKVLSKVQMNKSVIRIPNLEDFNDLEIWSFSDASLGNLNDKTESVGAHVIFIANRTTGKAAPVAWKGAKLKRVATATLEAEAMAMQAGLTAAVGIQQLAKECLGIKIPIIGVVDNYSCYEAVQSNKSVSNARLRCDLHCVKQMQKHKLVDKIIWLQGSLMLADCMTKKGQTGYDLLEVLQTGNLSVSMDAANASEYVMKYDPRKDRELGEYTPKW